MVSRESAFPGFSVYLVAVSHTAFVVQSTCVADSSFYSDTSYTGLKPTIMISFTLVSASKAVLLAVLLILK